MFIKVSGRSFDEIASMLNFDETRKTVIKEQLTTLDKNHPITHIQTFLHYLPALKKHTNKKALITQLKKIINADGEINLTEMGYLLCVQQMLGKKNTEEVDHKNHYSAIAHLLSVIAKISDDNELAQNKYYDLICENILPHAIAYSSPTINNDCVKQLYKDMNVFSSFKSSFRHNLLARIENKMKLNGKLSMEQSNLLITLQTVLK